MDWELQEGVKKRQAKSQSTSYCPIYHTNLCKPIYCANLCHLMSCFYSARFYSFLSKGVLAMKGLFVLYNYY